MSFDRIMVAMASIAVLLSGYTYFAISKDAGGAARQENNAISNDEAAPARQEKQGPYEVALQAIRSTSEIDSREVLTQSNEARCAHMRRSLAVRICQVTTDSFRNPVAGPPFRTRLAELERSCGVWVAWRTASQALSEEVSRKLIQDLRHNPILQSSYNFQRAELLCQTTAMGMKF